MDPRRLNTAAVLADGILNKPVPKTEIPEEREKVDGSGEGWSYIGDDAVVAAMEAGKVVSSSNYYGIPYVWKEGDGVYRGTLLQYRSITENPTFDTAEEAAEWFRESYFETDG